MATICFLRQELAGQNASEEEAQNVSETCDKGMNTETPKGNMQTDPLQHHIARVAFLPRFGAKARVSK